jgi:hypothetical protein
VIVTMSTVTSGGNPDSRDWLGLRWSAWMPLMAAHPLALAQLPAAPGIYRIRRADPSSELLWAGWARAGVREAVERLARQVYMPVEPYDDPMGPALTLWTARVHATASFQVSGARLDPSLEAGTAILHELARFTGDKTLTASDE